MSDEYLKNLKPGDVVIVNDSYNRKTIETVSRITKTMIMIRVNDRYESRYSIRGGFAVGEGMTFRKSYLREATPAAIDELKTAIKLSGLMAKVRNINISKLSIDQMERIIAITDEPTNGR